MKLERRFQSGFSLLQSYTWSHAIDNAPDGEDNNNGPTIPQDPFNTNAEKAPSGFDIKHRSVTSVMYELQFGRARQWLGGMNQSGLSKLARAVFGGFQIGGIFVAQTGPPVNLDVAGNPANTTSPVRPNRLGDGRRSAPRAATWIAGWIRRRAAVPAAFTYGNAGRNVLRAPGLVNLDFLVGRNFRLGETTRLELRGEFFNLTNTAHFGRPNATIGSPQAGRIAGTAAPNRQLSGRAAARLLIGARAQCVITAPARRAAPGLGTSGPSADYRTLGQLSDQADAKTGPHRPGRARRRPVLSRRGQHG
jgi:hypothetical protein